MAPRANLIGYSADEALLIASFAGAYDDVLGPPLEPGLLGPAPSSGGSGHVVLSPYDATNV